MIFSILGVMLCLAIPLLMLWMWDKEEPKK